MPVSPRNNLDSNSAPWGRWVDEQLDSINTLLGRSEQDQTNNNKQQNSSINALNQQLAVIQQQQDLLASYQTVKYAGTDTMVNGFSGWYNGGVPIVSLSSPTGRIEVGYGGSLNGGGGYFCYQVTQASTGSVIVSRDSVLSSASRRVAVIGGASFSPSGYRTEIISVPANVLINVSVQFNVQDTFVNILGGSIQAKVSP